MHYRKEIDGLRAIAVLPVIFFHAGFEAFKGGYVGVDVFFVISGYLITSLILHELEEGSFSILTFYERRARRILPVLFFIMLCCLPFAWLWLMPQHLKEFSHSLTAVSVFSSNLLFWKERGYFGAEAELKPLLHTWSLSVEEQYYLLFPPLVMVLSRLSKRALFGTLSVSAIASLALAQWGAYRKPTGTFFLLPTRGWEIAIGALIALGFLYKPGLIRSLTSKQRVNEVLSFLGLCLIALSALTFSRTTPFPSLYALIPTIGTALVIVFTTPDTISCRVLSSKPMVGIGLISYSLYLWHQPLFVFARHRSLDYPSVPIMLGLSGLAVVLSILSWRYIESPCRNRNLFGRKRIFLGATLGSAAFFLIGIAGSLNDGWATRIPNRMRDAVLATKQPNEKKKLWMAGPNNLIPAENSYVSAPLGMGSGRRIYLIGDSHAEALTTALEERLKNTGFTFMALTYQGCPPIRGIEVKSVENTRCYEHNEEVFRFITHSSDIEYVVLAARWELFLEDSRYDNGEGGVEFGPKVPIDLVVNQKPVSVPPEERKKVLKVSYINSVRQLLATGKKVILVYPVPEAGWDVPDYLSKLSLFNGLDMDKIAAAAGSTSYRSFTARNADTYSVLDEIGQYSGLYRVYPEKAFCNTAIKDRCIVHDNHEIYYSDDDHLSFFGARIVAEQVARSLNLHRP